MKGQWLRRPKGTMAVVFVHGILSSGEAAWLHKNNSYWPGLLKDEKELEDIGIYVFTYETNFFSGSYNLNDVVDSLKEFLNLDVLFIYKHIVFVCHSMGGIVTRKFIVERVNELAERKIKIGLFLLASPSLGSSYANLLSPLIKLLGNSQAHTLRFTENNLWLNSLDKEFQNLKSSNRLEIFGKELVEDRFILLRKFWFKQIVKPFSGAKYFGESYKVPNSDHFSIAKPENKDAIQHRLLCKFLKEFQDSTNKTKSHQHLLKENETNDSENKAFAGGHVFGNDNQEFNQSGTVINIFAFGPLHNEQLVVFLKTNSGLNEEFIRRLLKSREENHLPLSIDQNLLSFNVLSKSSLQWLSGQLQKEYDTMMLANKMIPNKEVIKNKIQDATTCFEKLEFDEAHRLLAESLKQLSPTDTHYNAVYKEYLITGFICYTRRNDIDGLKSLLHQKSGIGNEEIPDIDYLISLIFQEIFSRDTDISGLHVVVSRLSDIYKDASKTIKPAMANSLGLAYRRLGERTGSIDLEKAINIFKEGLELNKNNKMNEIELKDQMAIAHIRIFELNEDKEQLKIAEILLNDCLELLEGPMNPINYRLKPRVLNNFGNIYKQRTLIFNEISSAAKAIAHYEEAARYWNEKDASYDWALLRKNIAETKYAVGKLTNDSKILLEAMEDSIHATKYRNLTNSPYQWGKTVKITFSLVILLNKLKALNFIPTSMRKEILSYTDAIIEDEAKWSENISKELVQKAEQVQTLLF